MTRQEDQYDDILRRIGDLERAVNNLDKNKVDDEEYQQLKKIVNDLKERVMKNEWQIQNVEKLVSEIAESVESIATKVENRLFQLLEKVLKWAAIIFTALILILLGVKIADITGFLKLLGS